MIRLTTLLNEALREQTKDDALRILFVGDENMRFAKSIIKQLQAEGSVYNFKGTTASQILKIIKSRDINKYNVVVIMASSHDGAPGKSKAAISNLSEAFNIVKRSGAKLIAISNPTKSFLTKDDRNYKDHGYPSNDEIGTWVNQQTISDETIDVNSLGAKYLAPNHVSLNNAAQKYIAKNLLALVGELNIEPKDDVETAADTKSVAATKSSAAATAADVTDTGVTVDVTKGEMATPKQVFDFLVGKGLSPAGAAGILGNMKAESNFKTGALGDSGTSVGLVQWHASRKDRLMSWAKEKGLDPMSVNGQLEYLWWELTNKFSRLTNLLKTIQDPYEAAYQFAKQFERPAVIAKTRMIGAEQYFDIFNKAE